MGMGEEWFKIGDSKLAQTLMGVGLESKRVRNAEVRGDKIQVTGSGALPLRGEERLRKK